MDLFLKNEFTDKQKELEDMKDFLLSKKKLLSNGDFSSYVMSVNEYEKLKSAFLKKLNELHLLGLSIMNRLEYLNFQSYITKIKNQI